MNPFATILIPTHTHGPTISRALGSVLAQTVRDIEVFVIGDGAPDITRTIMADVIRQDARVRFFDHPKGPRHGEIYRHAALAEARGEIVCYLSDDDLYCPDHIETMSAMLREADFAHAPSVNVSPGDIIDAWMMDLSLPSPRRMLLAGFQSFSLSCGAHTREQYRRLSHGWRTTPPGTQTDLFMWQQILADPGCRVWSGTRPTVFHFRDRQRRSWTANQRCEELDRWIAMLGDSAARERVVYEVLDGIIRDQVALVARYDSLALDPLRRMARRLRRVPVAGEAAISITKSAVRGLVRVASAAPHRAPRRSPP